MFKGSVYIFLFVAIKKINQLWPLNYHYYPFPLARMIGSSLYIYISSNMRGLPIALPLLLLAAIASCTLFSVSPDFKVTYDKAHGELAHAYYEQRLNEQGTNYIHIYTNAEKTLLEQHQGAGFLEGYTTYKEIHAAYVNLEKFKLHAATAGPKLQAHLTTQLGWLEQMVENFPRDLYWRTVGAYIEQCRYTYRGYLQRLHEEGRLDLYIGFSQFYYLTSVGDFRELLPALTQEKYDLRDKSCTVYVRQEGEELIVAHSTMNYYQYMLRLFKTYHFPSRDPAVGSQSISFTARPGDFNSKDDFYVLSSGLRIVETSLLNFNKDNSAELTPHTVPCWLRATVASNLARDGQEWVNYFSKYNSGTHSSQWVVIDPSRLSSATNAVVFLEQAFSLIKIHDMTPRLLRDGFVASYNVAYDEEVYRKLGYEQYPYTFENDPRARILREYHPKMKTEADLQYWLLMNEEDDVREGIAPREDLYTADPQPYGIIDCKIITPNSRAGNYYWAISSPSTSNGRFPVFSWNAFPSIAHEGMPNAYNFTWQKVPLDFERPLAAPTPIPNLAMEQ